MRPKQLKEFLKFAIKNSFPLLLVGKPGIGKTDIIKQSAKDLGADIIISHPVVSDPTDYKGFPFVSPEGEAKFVPFSDLKRLVDAKKKTVFFLDDLGQAPNSVQAACMQLLLERRINGHKVSDDVVFMAATNRREDKAGVQGILEPVKSRFASIIEFEVNIDDWVEWAVQNDMPSELISYAQFKPTIWSDAKATKEIKNSPSPRTFSFVGRMMRKGIPNSKELEYEIFKGACGEEFAIEFISFLKVFRDLPTVEEIKQNPLKAKKPKQPAGHYAISASLAEHLNKDNADSIFKYIERLEKEYQVFMAKTAIYRNKDIASCPAFVNWASKNSGFIV